ncbi:hypothetical protein BDY19DRAFT_891932 [Irpex rosettiformis]|uniref:Uncharacterized protein n=1 Tax=Irpex rosettiformis TaxID=378272 RepID=A0ACB8U130_9APHY|nr:hypothetical protein BDY19DRAFT_891932 [Irpex rosettiformis]
MKLQVEEDRAKRAVRISSADKKAKESAVIVRSLIVGPHGILPPNAKSTKPISKPKIEKVKSQLLNPKTANRVIAQLRALPSYAESLPDKESGEAVEHTTLATSPPIHAVCLPLTDTEADEKHFSKLKESASNADLGSIVSVYNSSLTGLHSVFSQIDAVSLLTAPNLGLGEPGDGYGILSGAVPTAKTIIDGIQQITPQLMSLGYATGKSILPDHTGVHPPTDRISVFTYWWGFELTLPPPSMVYLSNAPSIAHNLINMLTALSAVNNGVREILPFVRYISQYVDTEFNMIKAQDQGKGVVCAATWLVPVALVPRPWDFVPASTVTIQPAPVDHDDPSYEATNSTDLDTTSPPQSPPTPSSRLASSPTLLPPLELHSTGFGESEKPDTTPPVDETPVEVDGDRIMDMDISASTNSVPAVTVVPPTPTASGLSRASGETTATEKS